MPRGTRSAIWISECSENQVWVISSVPKYVRVVGFARTVQLYTQSGKGSEFTGLIGNKSSALGLLHLEETLGVFRLTALPNKVNKHNRWCWLGPLFGGSNTCATPVWWGNRKNYRKTGILIVKLLDADILAIWSPIGVNSVFGNYTKASCEVHIYWHKRTWFDVISRQNTYWDCSRERIIPNLVAYALCIWRLSS